MLRKATFNSPRRAQWLMLGILLVAWGMWVLIIIPRTHMHPDESWTFDYMVAESPLALVQILTHDTHPPLWWIIFWTWQQATGGSEFTGRLLGTLFGMLALALVFRLGKTWFGAPRYGLFAASVLVFCAPFVWLSIEIRPYGLLFALTCYSMFSFRRWLVRQTWGSAVMYAVTCAMFMYIHYYLAFLIVAQVGYWLLARPSRRQIQQGFGVAALALLVWLPWCFIFLRQVNFLRTITPSEQGGIGFIPTTSPTNWTTIYDLVTTLANGHPLMIPLLLGLGVVMLWRKPAYRLMLTWAIVPLTLVLLINMYVEVFTLRYLSFALIGVMVACGMALAALPGWWGWLSTGIITAALAFNLASYLPVHPPYRAMLQTMNAAATPDDVLYMDFAQNDERHMLRQFALYLRPDLHDQLVTVLPVQPAKRIWHITNALLAPEKWEHFQQLNDGSRVVKLSYGECSPRYCLTTQLLESPPLDEPQQFGDSVLFFGSEIRPPADTAAPLEVILWWRFDTPPPMDYSIGLYLVDAGGVVVSQTDGTIHNYYGGAEVLMTAAELGHYYLDVRHLSISADAPRDQTYTLLLAVYDWQNGQRLRVNDSDTLSLGTVVLPASGR